MKIGILGTGGVGRAFASRLTELGHSVMLGTREVESTMSKKGENTVAEFLNKNQKVKLGTFLEAAGFGEMVLNVSKGANSLDVIRSAGKNLDGKVLVDISNPLDFSKGMPPSLIPEFSNTFSLGEAIQKEIPNAKVVKTLNTMWNGIMINPSIVADGNHINYICGNDEDAKSIVKALLREFGWKNESLLDLGDITAARASEATLPIWLRVYGAKKTGAFNFQIVGQ
jgi:predicted dinucleotide-binding enzyme